MILQYNTTVEDFIAFSRYVWKSPAMRRINAAFIVLLWVLLIAAAFIISLILPAEELPRSLIIVVTIGVALVGSVLIVYLFPPFMDQVIRLYFKKGSHQGVLGWHELEITVDGLIERTEINESRYSWNAIEQIADTPTHVFITLGNMMGFAISREAVTAGDVDAFVARASQLWAAQNPDAATASPL